MPNRYGQDDDYRYGFQNQENDDEIYGSKGTAVNYKYRMNDTRIGRFFAVDPLASSYPWNSPYAFSENRVIDAIELEGLEKFRIIDQVQEDGTAIKIIRLEDILSDFVVIDENGKESYNFKYRQFQEELQGIYKDEYNNLINPNSNNITPAKPFTKPGENPTQQWVVHKEAEILTRLGSEDLVSAIPASFMWTGSFTSTDPVDLLKRESLFSKATRFSSDGFSIPDRIDVINVGVDLPNFSSEQQEEFKKELINQGFDLDRVQVNFTNRSDSEMHLEIDILKYEVSSSSSNSSDDSQVSPTQED